MVDAGIETLPDVMAEVAAELETGAQGDVAIGVEG